MNTVTPNTKSNYNFCIDFGTCNTVISYCQDDNILQIQDEISGDVLLPTTIYFSSESIKPETKISELKPSEHYFIGSGANEMFQTEKNNLLYFYQFKRFLGITSKSIDKYKVFLDKFNLEYTTDEDTIYFFIQFNEDSKLKISIIDLIKLYFQGLHQILERKFNLNEQNIQSIITCPAYFNDLQRSQLKRASESAGFIISKILNEPTTAAIYYINKYIIKVINNNNIEKNQQNEQSDKIKQSNKFIIYDLGGGTIDTTVVEYHIEDNTCEVIDIDGNNSLGGIDIDNIIITDIYDRFLIDKNNLKWKSKIRKCAEEIKIKLTYSQNHDIHLESVPVVNQNKIIIKDNLKISYSRHTFNTIINGIIDQMIEPIKSMHLKHETKNIIFIGGPTQIPLLQNKVSSYLNVDITTSENFEKNNLNLYKTIVSQGGTLLSKLLEDKTSFYLLDIIPMNIGISNDENQMVIMIEKNSKIPLTVEKIFTTSHDCQRTIDIEIFEGVEKDCASNTFIGSYKIMGIPPLPRGSILIKLLFKISYNGVLEVSINGFKNSSNDDTKSFDFKLCENIKLIPNILAKELLKKLLLANLKKT
jgi:molecular chaperone DnaK (HSP70)